MDANALARAVSIDQRGCVPVMIAATAGTTNAGMIDPLAACAEVAHSAGTWFHVDAAWGGAVIASERLRPVLMALGTLTRSRSTRISGSQQRWVRHVHYAACASALGRVSGFDKLHAVQYRRARSLCYFGSMVAAVPRAASFPALAAAGWDGYGAHVERSTELTALLRKELLARKWLIGNRVATCRTMYQATGDFGEVSQS